MGNELISRQMVFDVLIPFLNEKDDMEMAGQILARISMIPTAYNPKQVVKDIESYSRSVYGEISPVRVISIVRKGGV